MNKSYKPISPLQSPNSGSKYNNNYPYTTTPAAGGGSVTPPYYSGMAKDLQRPVMKDVYTDDAFSDDFYKNSSSSSTLDLPRKNSNSPAPSSPMSYR